jgi:LuxR family quorum sensing-dependent transcriptional regulator
MAEARENGLVDGYSVPIFSLGGAKSVVSFASDRPLDLSKPMLAAAHLVAIYAYHRLHALAGDRQAAALLTPREREVLAWAAAGKSGRDIAQLLDLAVGTVNFHLSRIREKLNAVTTTQAVAVAVRDGHLS